jgi:hypothetical protein
MAAIVAVAPQVIGQPMVDRQVMDALWTLSTLSRAWGLEPDGMLQRNGFLNAEDTERFAGWVEAIEWAIFMLLDADGTHSNSAIIEEALASYRQITDRDFPPER